MDIIEQAKRVECNRDETATMKMAQQREQSHQLFLQLQNKLMARQKKKVEMTVVDLRLYNVAFSRANT